MGIRNKSVGMMTLAALDIRSGKMALVALDMRLFKMALVALTMGRARWR